MEKSNELWKGYVRDFIKLKLESSPHNYATKEEYATSIYDKMGIQMDVNKIEPNPGKEFLKS